MPDWTIHLGVSSLLAQKYDRQRPWLLLLGGVLVDFIARLDAVLLDILRVETVRGYSFDCFHTPFMVLLVALWIALIYPAADQREMKENFFFLLVSGGFHFLFDMLEVKITGFGEHLLFPFSAQVSQFNLIHPESWHYYGLYALMLGALAVWFYAVKQLGTVVIIPPWATWKKHWQQRSKTTKKLWGVLTLIILLVPFYGAHFFYEQNAGYSKFLADPAAYQGKKVGLYVSRVLSLNPLVVEEYPHQFTLLADHIKQPIAVGDWISVYGLYDGKRILVEKLEREWGAGKKSLLSLVGLFFVLAGAGCQQFHCCFSQKSSTS